MVSKRVAEGVEEISAVECVVEDARDLSLISHSVVNC
jgi:hypothetical protein